MMYQPELETLPREKLRALQEERLKRLVVYVYERVPFYRRLLDEAGVDPKGFRGLEDLPGFPSPRRRTSATTTPSASSPCRGGGGQDPRL